MSIDDARKRSSRVVLLALAVFFAHLIYLMVGLHTLKQTHEWPVAPELPLWGSIAVVLAATATAAVCTYLAAADMTVVRIVWAAAVVTAECVNIAWAVEGNMLEMATNASSAAVLALAECLLILPLLVFGIFPPKTLRTPRH